MVREINFNFVDQGNNFIRHFQPSSIFKIRNKFPLLKIILIMNKSGSAPRSLYWHLWRGKPPPSNFNLCFKKKKYFFGRGNFILWLIFLWRVVGFSHKIVINLPALWEASLKMRSNTSAVSEILFNFILFFKSGKRECDYFKQFLAKIS